MHVPPEVVRHARQIAAEQAMKRFPPTCRIVESSGNCGVMVTVWDHRDVMPTAGSTRRPKPGPKGLKDVVKAAILDAIGAAGKPLTTKDVARELREARVVVGASTVLKALAELTQAGQLVNPRDRRGYRLPGDAPPAAPSLF